MTSLLIFPILHLGSRNHTYPCGFHLERCSVLTPSSGSCYAHRTVPWPIWSCDVPLASAELGLSHVAIWALFWHCFKCHGLQIQGGAAIFSPPKISYSLPSNSMSLPLRGFGILSCFLWIIQMYTRSSLVHPVQLPRPPDFVFITKVFPHLGRHGNIQYRLLWESCRLPQAILLKALYPPTVSDYLKIAS